MDDLETRILRAIQHLVTTARFKAYHKESHDIIADLLDRADHLFNLVTEDKADFDKIHRILQNTLLEYPECSTSLLRVKGQK